MKLSTYYFKISALIIICLLMLMGCNEKEKRNELVGIWLAAAPYQEGLFYRPNLIADITPDKMTIYEDISNPTTFDWSQKKNIVYYENPTQKNELEIIDNQLDTLIVKIGVADTLRFIRLLVPNIDEKSEMISDASIFSFLFSNTFELNIPSLNWQIRKIHFLEGGKFIHYENEILTNRISSNFEIGNWELLVIRNQYFLFLDNLKSEKPLLIHLENLNNFKLGGQVAFADNLHWIDLQTITNQDEITVATNNLIVGQWEKPVYIFKGDSTFVEIVENDTLSGEWKLNTTNELILLTNNHKTLQFGFINSVETSINMQYLTDFHNEFTTLEIKKN